MRLARGRAIDSGTVAFVLKSEVLSDVASHLLCVVLLFGSLPQNESFAGKLRFGAREVTFRRQSQRGSLGKQMKTRENPEVKKNRGDILEGRN